MVSPTQELSWPEEVVEFFLDVFGLGAEPRPERRLDHLPYSLHLTSGAGSVNLFPAGPLDVFCFFQRHHASLHHEYEYVAAIPEAEGDEEDAAQGTADQTEHEHQIPKDEYQAKEQQEDQHEHEELLLVRLDGSPCSERPEESSAAFLQNFQITDVGRRGLLLLHTMLGTRQQQLG